jgi:hypothetical protein
MTKFNLVNMVTEEAVVLTTKKDVAQFIKDSGVTENSFATIQGKIKDGVTLYETYKIEELEEEKEMTTVNNEVQEKLEEVIELVEEVKEDVVVEEMPVAEEIVEETPVAEGEETPTADEKVEDVPTENKRRIGKRLIASKNGEVYETFPSIKACAAHFKELLGLGHMPFTPIMKSVRQDTDWNEYSFKFENEDDIHTPTSRKEANAENASVPAEKKSDEVSQSDEVIEEITEEELV